MKYIESKLNADKVNLKDTNNNYTSENVEGALEEIDSKIKIIEANAYDDTKIKQEINDIKTKKIYQFDSVASMKAYNLKVGEVCETLGYYKPNDGGGAKYYIRGRLENEVTDDGSTHYIGNNIIAELVVDNYIDVKVFGAKGDNVTDDTKCIQNLVNYCTSNKKEMYVSDGTYILTSPININGSISIFGNGNNGLSEHLGGASSTFIINHEGIGFDISPPNYNFRRTVLNGFCIRCHDNFKTNTNMVGVLVSNICHVLLEKISVQEFRSGVGIRMGSNDANAKFQGQYSSISKCLLAYNLINIEVNKYNGINVVNNVIDGNNNGSDLHVYENGFPPGSYGIKVNSGDTCMIINNIIQGHQFGIYSNTGSTTIEQNRLEMTQNAIYLDSSSSNCVIGRSNTSNNYLLLDVNGLSTDKLYGTAITNVGSNNIINYVVHGSIIYDNDTGSNTIREDSQRVVMYLGNISESKKVSFPSYYSKSYILNKMFNVGFTASNLEEIDKNYSNRWRIEVANMASMETCNTSDYTFENNNFITLNCSDDIIRKNYINFIKNGSASELKDVVIYFDLKPY